MSHLYMTTTRSGEVRLRTTSVLIGFVDKRPPYWETKCHLCPPSFEFFREPTRREALQDLYVHHQEQHA